MERSIMNSIVGDFELIDFYKYLNCTACREAGLYCPEHRAEVETILEGINQN